MDPVNIGGVDVLHWNPKQPLPLRPRRYFAWTRRLPLASRVDNFGDLIGPKVVRQFVDSHGLQGPRSRSGRRETLGAVGSIIHMLPDGATVWGAGVNGKHLELALPRRLEFSAVRGPLTGRYLEKRGRRDPGVYGDPALLLDYGGQSRVEREGLTHRVLCIHNMNDALLAKGGEVGYLSPNSPFDQVISEIKRSGLVVGSSLHAIVVAEALGIPARAIASGVEPDFKYLDYYEGTGRVRVKIAKDVREALELGGVDSPPLLDSALSESFPAHLWSAVTGER